MIYNDRVNIERWRKEGRSGNDIAKLLGKSEGCIHREIKQGTVSLIGTDNGYYRNEVYSADAGQRLYHKTRRHCGAKCRLTQTLRETIVNLLMLDDSPYAISCQIGIPERTIYDWIDKGKLGLTREEALTYPQKQSAKRERPKQCHQFGKSIDERPEAINQRLGEHDYEIDTVIPRRHSAGVLLTLTNRKSRFEWVRLIADRSAASVNQALCEIKETFTIDSMTADNGTEFARLAEVQDEVYYARAYSRWGRGCNENQSRMIRWKVPKGAPAPSQEKVAEIQNWMNHCPRKMFHGKSALEMFSAR